MELMVTTYDNTNHGVLFRNSHKEVGDKRPDFQGEINVAGKEFQLAGWLRESKKGAKFLSLKITPSEDCSRAVAPPPIAADEDIPWR
jgi:uncharacterized protein (DUF736 family)